MSAHNERTARMDNLADKLRNASIGHPNFALAEVTADQLKKSLPGHNWSRTGDVLMNLGLILGQANNALYDDGRGAEERCNALIDVMMLAGQLLYADRSSR